VGGAEVVGGSCDAGSVIERAVNFERQRRLRCGGCSHEWLVTAEWLDRFNRALEACPECGTDCQGEDRPDFCARPEDTLHDDSTVREFYWYHSSTHENWPDEDFDPAANLTEVSKRRMETMVGRGAVERWAKRQKIKALHIGTYEAAVENMIRRMHDQGSSADDFFLYRVQLRLDCLVEAGVHKEPTDFVGDAHLAEVCGPGVKVLRYVNVHEDPSSISLAIGPAAIHSVQRVSIPLPVDPADAWTLHATARLLDAASRPAQQPKEAFRQLSREMTSVLASEARRLEMEVAATLPLALRERFHVGFDEAYFPEAPAAFPAKLIGMARLVTDPHAVLESLDSQPWRAI